MPGRSRRKTLGRVLGPRGQARRWSIETPKRGTFDSGNRFDGQAPGGGGPEKSAKAIVRSLEREKAQGSIRRRCGLNAHKGPRGIRLRMYPVAELQASSLTKPRFDRAWVCDNGKRGRELADDAGKPRPRRKLRRENPTGAAGTKQGRPGSRGSKPSRG